MQIKYNGNQLLNFQINSKLLWSLILIVIVGSSCRKFVDIPPPTTALTRQNVYSSDATSIAVLTGLYASMSPASIFSANSSISMQCGLSADELTLFSSVTRTDWIGLYRNSLSASQAPQYFSALYKYILTVNSAIEGITTSNSLTLAVKQQLLGEAKFLRAFYYFYLVNLYGDVPLITTSDWSANASHPRDPKSDVYKQIVSDLKDAQDLLSENYLSATLLNITTEKVRPNKWTATALLARVYLYTGEWAKAESEATSLIASNKYSLETDLTKVFLKNSTEAIWQLQPVNTGWNTEDARVFILTASGPNSSAKPVYLASLLVQSFEANDQRKIRWTGNVTVSSKTYYYPNKYKSATSGAAVTEYLMMFRLSELYLIRSEARAQQNNLAGSIADLDLTRQRAGLTLIANTNPGISQTALLATILHERQVELFTELAHRWFDLKRTGNIDAVMSVVTPTKGGVWNSFREYFPITINDALYFNLTQTPGY